MKRKEMTLQSIYEIVCQYPGSETPVVCLELCESDLNLQGSNWATSVELASWFADEHKEKWDTFCCHVDELIDVGDIIFTDDGRLYPAGFEGEVIGQKL